RGPAVGAVQGGRVRRLLRVVAVTERRQAAGDAAAPRGRLRRGAGDGDGGREQLPGLGGAPARLGRGVGRGAERVCCQHIGAGGFSFPARRDGLHLSYWSDSQGSPPNSQRGNQISSVSPCIERRSKTPSWLTSAAKRSEWVAIQSAR